MSLLDKIQDEELEIKKNIKMLSKMALKTSKILTQNSLLTIL